MTNIIIPSKQTKWSEVMKLAQSMFDRRAAATKHNWKKHNEVLEKMSEQKHYMNPLLGQHMYHIPTAFFFDRFKEDRYFWDDEKNVKKFAEDNPEVKRRRPIGYRSNYYQFK